MPLYDRTCTVGCGWQVVDRWEPVQTVSPLCPTCGAPTVRAWLTTAATVIGDEMDHVQVNGTKEPIRFRSKQEFKRWMKQKGYRVYDTHVGDTGSDKSKHTTDWSRSYDPYTAENVRILLERAFTQPARSEPPVTMHITPTSGTYQNGKLTYDR